MINQCQRQRNFIVITLRHRCSPVNLLHIFRTPFTKLCHDTILTSYFPGKLKIAAVSIIFKKDDPQI